MRYHTMTYWRRICVCILCVTLLMSNILLPVHAESDPLKPADIEYENGNIVLHKQATRTAADEWEIDVQAKINDTPVEPPKLEVAFVLDASSSMYGCADEYLHNNFWYHYAHGTSLGISGTCDLICSESHTHTDSCYSCGTYVQTHNDNKNCTYVNEEGETVPFSPTRFDVAKQVITKMIAELPEGTRIGKVAFSNSGMAQYFETFDDIDRYAFTYMMDGISLALTPEGKHLMVRHLVLLMILLGKS